jgi:hypothetical protein
MQGEVSRFISVLLYFSVILCGTKPARRKSTLKIHSL